MQTLNSTCIPKIILIISNQHQTKSTILKPTQLNQDSISTGFTTQEVSQIN
jgi:hypothetical protein